VFSAMIFSIPTGLVDYCKILQLRPIFDSPETGRP
jgi:hypothetical protein